MEALEGEGYTVRPALTGQMALEAARKEPPDLILLDIMMPGMNGYQVCQAIKDDAHLKDIPVIFISALDEMTDKMKGFSVGGVDYISKPFQMKEVLARAETHLTLAYLRKKLEDKNIHLQQVNEKLQYALNEIKTLRGILPICSYCKKIRNDDDSWHTIEKYISEHSDVQFSHGICQDCAQKIYPDLIDQED